jgi:hypothetical protein
VHPDDGRRAHARVLVAGREIFDHVAMLGVFGDLRHGGGADARVRMLPPRLWLESIQERHQGACNPGTAAGKLRAE